MTAKLFSSRTVCCILIIWIGLTTSSTMAQYRGSHRHERSFSPRRGAVLPQNHTAAPNHPGRAVFDPDDRRPTLEQFVNSTSQRVGNFFNRVFNRPATPARAAAAQAPGHPAHGPYPASSAGRHLPKPTPQGAPQARPSYPHSGPGTPAPGTPVARTHAFPGSAPGSMSAYRSARTPAPPPPRQPQITTTSPERLVGPQRPTTATPPIETPQPPAATPPAKTTAAASPAREQSTKPAPAPKPATRPVEPERKTHIISPPATREKPPETAPQPTTRPASTGYLVVPPQTDLPLPDLPPAPGNSSKRSATTDTTDDRARNDSPPPPATRSSPDYPTAEPTATPGQVISPFPPRQILDVTGMKDGDLCVDPRNGKVFLLP